MIEEDSAGFVEAFTAAVRPHESRSRPLRWMLLIGFAVVFAAMLGALLNGAFGGGNGSSGSTAGASLTGAQGSVYTAVAGPGCTGSGASFGESGFSGDASDPSTEWVASSTGGFKGDDCSGAYVSMPVSGQVSAFDTGRYTLWSFRLGVELAEAMCELQMYIPAATSLGLVGGDFAYYYAYDAVYASSRNTAKQVGDFVIDQTTDRGTWVTAGTVSVTTGAVSVRMVDAGSDHGSGAAGVVRLAAAQIRLSCWAAVPS